MPQQCRRAPGRRLIVTLVALASVIAGYYLGQYWQRRPLAELSAVVYPSGRVVDYAAAFALNAEQDAQTPWRLFVVMDSRLPACSRLLRHYAIVFNRLAAWPEIQENLRLTMLAYDQPDQQAIARFTGAVGWAEVLSAPAGQLDRLSTQLGIQPDRESWCEAPTANAILVAPDRKRWALIPHEPAVIMANNIRTIIAFVE